MEGVEKKIFDVCIAYVEEIEGRRLNLNYPFSRDISLYIEIDSDWRKREGSIVLRNGEIEIHTDNSEFRCYFEEKLFD